MNLFKLKILFVFLKILIFSFFVTLNAHANLSQEGFDIWIKSYKEYAHKKGISKKTINSTLKNAKFLEKVIIYDRKQPEFFEKTDTYVKKRASNSRAKKGKNLLRENFNLFNEIETNFNVEKELLIALWGIETNFGKHVGKMDIISSLATLSYDTRRSDFFSNQLLILLGLIDNNLIDPKLLYGSWAGAFGNFQFMPSTIKNYALDYDKNDKIELKKSLKDSLASAANYIKKIGWRKGEPCFYKVELTKKLKNKYINVSARKIHHRYKISYWKNLGIEISDDVDINDKNYKAALVLPDGDLDSPAFLVFSNYEKILKWNRSLRFGIAVCTLSRMI